jgi:hypothetical protein
MRATIRNIFMNPALTEAEIQWQRDKNNRLKQKIIAYQILLRELGKEGAEPPIDESAKQIHDAVNVMDGTILHALVSGGGTVEAELWQMHAEHINNVYKQGGKGRGFKKITYHPMILNWAIAFLVRTSASVNNDVAKVMMLPHISHIYKKTAELVSTENDKAYGLHMTTIQTLGEHACCEKRSSYHRIGVIAQDSANIKAGIEHDNRSNELKGGDKTHSIITLMFQALAQKVKDATSEANAKDNVTTFSAQQQNISILDNLTLAEEHLVFKYSIMDPNIKCSKVVATVNMNKVVDHLRPTMDKPVKMYCYIFPPKCTGTLWDRPL